MARPVKPWYRKQNKTWYVELNGKQHNLGKDKKQAEKRFHELMVERDKSEAERARTPDSFLACEIADKFIGWCSNHRAKRTTEDYQEHLESFFKWLPGGKFSMNSTSLIITRLASVGKRNNIIRGFV